MSTYRTNVSLFLVKFVLQYHVTLFCELLIFVVFVVVVCEYDDMGLYGVAERKGIKAITICGTSSSCDVGGWADNIWNLSCI